MIKKRRIFLLKCYIICTTNLKPLANTRLFPDSAGRFGEALIILGQGFCDKTIFLSELTENLLFVRNIN